MAIETQYNIVKVNELRPITTAQGVDEIIINDVDSFPLETKKITAENFAYSIKDYILPIAGEGANGVLGGVKIGDGLTINPITGVLSNDVLILDDLDDVIILNPEAGHVLRYNGVQWINEAEGGIVNVIAGEGLSGGGTQGDITIDVNAGRGLSIVNDAVTVNANAGLEIVNDQINVRINSGLTFTENKITIVPGVGLNISNNSLNFVPSLGLEQNGAGIKVDEGRGLTFVDNNLTVDLGGALYFNNNKIDIQDATYTVKGVSKFAPLVDRIEDIRGTSSYEEDFVNPAFVDKMSSVPTGAVFFFAMRQAPDGYLFCDGSTVSQTTYPYLFQAIGNLYNDGSEATGQFRLPDLRDEFLRGATTTDAVAAPGTRSRIVGSKESDRYKSHNHKIDLNYTEAFCVTPGAFPTTNTSGFVWGFTMNNCTPPHRQLSDGTYQIGDGDYYYNFENGQFQQSEINEVSAADASPFYTEPNIPPGCARVSMPVRLDVSDQSITVSPEGTIPVTDVDETRPRNIALLPCIKT
jgi:microcystin-dependent protein